MIQTFQDILQKSLLSGIIKQAQKHNAIDEWVKIHLDEEVKPHCKVAQLKGNTLIIHVDNSAWLTKLRFYTPKLIKALQGFSDLKTLQKIQYKIRPFDFNPPTTSNT